MSHATSLWSEKDFEKISDLLERKGVENWIVLCKELSIRKGLPGYVVTDAHYGNKPTADKYDFEKTPRYDPVKKVVVVRNPFSSVMLLVIHRNKADIVCSEFVEIDEEIARRVLVLGVP